MRADIETNDLPSVPLPAIIQTLIFWRWPLAYLERCHARYGGRFVVRAYDMPSLVFLSKPADIKALIGASAEALHPGAGSEVIGPLVGEGSFMLQEEDEHMAGRRAIVPAFHHKAIQSHSGRVADIVERTVASWPLGVPLAMHPLLRSMTLWIVLRTLFDTADARLQALHEHLFSMLSIAAHSLLMQEPILRKAPGSRGVWNRFLKRRAQARALILELIVERRDGARSSGGALEALFAAVNADGSPMSLRQIHDNIMTLIVSGHESTASELAWAFQLLAYNQSEQRKLRVKIDAGDDTYLTATVQEVLRHRPVFLFTIPRAVVRPVQIGGRTYRPPVHLLGCIYLMHHDPALYRDPHAFRPERFVDAPPAQTWLPWGGGRKRCPGRHLATLEMQTVLRTVISRLDVLPARGEMERACWRSAIVTPHAGSRVVLRARGGAGRAFG